MAWAHFLLGKKRGFGVETPVTYHLYVWVLTYNIPHCTMDPKSSASKIQTSTPLAHKPSYSSLKLNITLLPHLCLNTF